MLAPFVSSSSKTLEETTDRVRRWISLQQPAAACVPVDGFIDNLLCQPESRPSLESVSRSRGRACPGLDPGGWDWGLREDRERRARLSSMTKVQFLDKHAPCAIMGLRDCTALRGKNVGRWVGKPAHGAIPNATLKRASERRGGYSQSLRRVSMNSKWHRRSNASSHRLGSGSRTRGRRPLPSSSRKSDTNRRLRCRRRLLFWLRCHLARRQHRHQLPCDPACQARRTILGQVWPEGRLAARRRGA